MTKAKKIVMWQSRMYSPANVARKYARCSVPCGASRLGYFIDEVNAEGYTIRTVKVPRSSLSKEIVEQCNALYGHAFNAVEIKK